MDGGLATSSTSSFRTCGCISSCPVDLCTFRLDGLKPDLLLQWMVLHSPSPPFGFCNLIGMARALASEY